MNKRAEQPSHQDALWMAVDEAMAGTQTVERMIKTIGHVVNNQVRDPFAVATAQAQEMGFEDFSEGSPGRAKRDEIAEAVKVGKQGPPGPPPRPGLQWNPDTHRWIHPQTGSSLKEGEFEDLKGQIEHGLGRARTDQERETFQAAARAGNRGDYQEAGRLAALGALARVGVDISDPEKVRQAVDRIRQRTKGQVVIKELTKMAKGPCRK